MKKSIIYSIAIVGASLLTVSCDNTPTIDEGIVIEDLKNTEELTEDLFESPDVDYHLPSAIQIASIFKKSGMKFNASAMNSTDNSINYTSQKSQMLNFGVYSADIAYCITNEQTDEASGLFDVIQELADAQGMSAVFDNKDLLTKFKSSLDNPDSIQSVMFDIHERTEEYMDDNDMMHVSAVHFAGAWVEGMYLGVFDFENNEKKEGVGSQITEQMEILKNIIKGLQDPKNSESGLETVIADLEKIQNTYSEFETVKVFHADENAIELNLSIEEFSKLSELIKDIRASIVNA